MNLKKLFTLLSLLLVTTTATLAQFKSGDFLIDASVSITKTEWESIYSFNNEIGVTKTTNSFISVIPKAHYFITDNFSISLGLGLENQKLTFTQFVQQTQSLQELENETELFLVDLGIRAYNQLSDRFSFYSGISSTLGFGENKPESPNPQSIYSDIFEIDLAFTTGFALVISEKLLATASANPFFYTYNIQKAKNTDIEIKRSVLNFGLGSSFSLGFSIKL